MYWTAVAWSCSVHDVPEATKPEFEEAHLDQQPLRLDTPFPQTPIYPTPVYTA